MIREKNIQQKQEMYSEVERAIKNTLRKMVQESITRVDKPRNTTNYQIKKGKAEKKETKKSSRQRARKRTQQQKQRQ